MERSVSDRPLTVYVIQGRGERDYADCQAALARVPARLQSLSFIGDPDEVVARARDADALIVSSSPITRRVLESLEGLQAVIRPGWATTSSTWPPRPSWAWW
jgi:hypothetical protein